MFTINIYLRFALIAICLLGGIGLMLAYGFWYAFPFLLTGIILLAGYIAFGTVNSAGQLVQQMQFVEAEDRLRLTWKPDWLYKTPRAFYYILKGTLAMQRKSQDEAEEYLEKARAIDLPTDNEKAMVELQLASIHANRGRWKQAQVAYHNLKKLNITEPQIKMQVAEFDKVMKNRGSIQQAKRMNKGGIPTKPGGKRRRPKMR